jgi:RND family efflux transporter MFP subunit
MIMSTRMKLLKIFLPISIILIGLGGMLVLINARPEPLKVESEVRGALVQVLELSREDRQVLVHGAGTVEASQRAEIVPRVSGRIEEFAPNLVAGGFFREGELLFRVEDIDYQLAVDRAGAAVAKAEYDLAREESNSRVARQEWERLQLSSGEVPNPLVLNEPQLNKARADLAAARASLRQAELDLERTTVRAPFNGLITSASIAAGQYVRAGTVAAVMSGTDVAEILVPLPADEAAWLAVPRSGTSAPGSRALIRLPAGAREFTWEGRVTRSLGVIDPVSRLARLVVTVRDPYNLTAGRPAGHPELTLGAFVEVNFFGEQLREVTAIPRRALHEGGMVWLMDGEDTLRMRKVEVLRLEQDEVLIRNGLAAGERLVLTNLSGAMEGMQLRALEVGARP